MNNNPFFSIVIPTFNRANDLKMAVKCILMQNYKDFELIISDNNSQDKTEGVVAAFKDKRIKYFKNKKNIGWILNLKQAISRANGQYVILHGDDDFMLYGNALKSLQLLLSKTQYGFVRMNYLSRTEDKKSIFEFHRDVKRDINIKPMSSNWEIVNFIEKADPFFITGIVFKNYFNAMSDISSSEWAPWFMIILKQVSKNGGYFIKKHFFVSSWSTNASHIKRYCLIGGKFCFEGYFDQVFDILDRKKYKKFLNKHLKRIIWQEFPLSKYFTGNKNLIYYSSRLIGLSSEFRFSPFFWFFLVSSIITPRFILGLARLYFINRYSSGEIPNYLKIKRRINYLESNNEI